MRLLLRGRNSLLASTFDVVAAVVDGQQAVEATAVLQPEVIDAGTRWDPGGRPNTKNAAGAKNPVLDRDG
jgi:hypothetical protein